MRKTVREHYDNEKFMLHDQTHGVQGILDVRLTAFTVHNIIWPQKLTDPIDFAVFLYKVIHLQGTSPHIYSVFTFFSGCSIRAARKL